MHLRPRLPSLLLLSACSAHAAATTLPVADLAPTERGRDQDPDDGWPGTIQEIGGSEWDDEPTDPCIRVWATEALDEDGYDIVDDDGRVVVAVARA